MGQRFAESENAAGLTYTGFSPRGELFFKQIRCSMAAGLKTQTSAARVHCRCRLPRLLRALSSLGMRAVRPLAGGRRSVQGRKA